MTGKEEENLKEGALSLLLGFQLWNWITPPLITDKTETKKQRKNYETNN